MPQIRTLDIYIGIMMPSNVSSLSRRNSTVSRFRNGGCQCWCLALAPPQYKHENEDFCRYTRSELHTKRRVRSKKETGQPKRRGSCSVIGLGHSLWSFSEAGSVSSKTLPDTAPIYFYVMMCTPPSFNTSPSEL